MTINRINLGLAGAMIIAVMCLTPLWGCDTGIKLPTCAGAVNSIYDNGCYWMFYGIPVTSEIAREDCNAMDDQALDAGCSREFREVLGCLAWAESPYCDDRCTNEIGAYYDCMADAPAPVCVGYTGSDTACCRTDDPCYLQYNGTCDCDEACSWDDLDCGSGGAVDILVMVDNSRSMTEEQMLFAEQFASLIEDLVDPPIDPWTGEPQGPPVTDIHVGVISSDMGTGGYTVETCSDPVDGDDGVLQHEPSPYIPGCEWMYPTYLSYQSSSLDAGQLNDLTSGFECIANLGTNGCGFEQQLKAMDRALEHTHDGGPNDGFLRDDSTLVLIWVTDEEDCSVSDPRIFDTTDSSLGHINLRCYLHPYMVYPVSTYTDALHELRPSGNMMLGFVVGVPSDPVCVGYGDRISDCLYHPDMIEAISPSDPTRLDFSCSTYLGYAYPPRRLVQVAQQFGSNAYVTSICTDNYDGLFEAIATRVPWL